MAAITAPQADAVSAARGEHSLITPLIADPKASEDLDAHIQALPQELQDAILDSTGIFEIPAVVSITKDYKPPVALQLSHKIRAQFAETYYTNAAFSSQPGSGDSSYLQYHLGWMTALSTEHLQAIRVLRFTMIAIPEILQYFCYQCLFQDLMRGGTKQKSNTVFKGCAFSENLWVVVDCTNKEGEVVKSIEGRYTSLGR